MEGQWFEEELAGCRLGDGRLDRRLRQLVEQMEAGFGESIPLACQDWANTKAAYRFFSNDRVSEEDILRGHFDATQRRFVASDGPILVLHDTGTGFRSRDSIKPHKPALTPQINPPRTHSPLKGGLPTPAAFGGCIPSFHNVTPETTPAPQTVLAGCSH